MAIRTMNAVIALAASLTFGNQLAIAQQHHGQAARGGTGAAMGQQMMSPGMKRGGKMRHMMQGGMMGSNCPMMGTMMGGSQGKYKAGRIAFLKAELDITDAQKDAFDKYAQALADNIDKMHSMRQSMMRKKATKSAVERLEAHLSMMEKRVASLKALKPALGNFYATLSDAQKEKADAILTGMGCMM